MKIKTKRLLRVYALILTPMIAILFIGYAQSKFTPNPSISGSSLTIIADKISDRRANNSDHILVNNNSQLCRTTALQWLQKRDTFYEKCYHHFISIIEPKYSRYTEYGDETWFHELGITIIKVLGCVYDEDIQNELLILQNHYKNKNFFIKEEINFLISPHSAQMNPQANQ